jgi:hypothetical protein
MRNVLIGVGLVMAAAGAALGQCTPSWDRTHGNAAVNGYIGAMMPWEGGLLVGGSFTTVGIPGTDVIAQYDPVTHAWSALGGGLNHGTSNAFATGFTTWGSDLIVTGFFQNAGGVPDTKSIARWDGTAWNPVVTGWNTTGTNSVWSFCKTSQFGGEKLFFGGVFDSVNGQPAANVGVWDGTTATPLVTLMPLVGINPIVSSMIMHDDGMGGGPQLYIGGRFVSVDGVPALTIARWNGTAWSAVGSNLGNTIASAEVDTMLVWNGQLYVGGSNLRVNGALQQTARWDGTTWTAVGQNTTGRVWTLATFDDGSGEKLYAGGTFAGLSRLARLEGNTWVTVDGGSASSVFKFLNHDGKLWVGASNSTPTTPALPADPLYARTSCPACGPQDFNGDGDFGTDQDIEAFFACLGGSCCATCWYLGSDFNGDGDFGTDQDIEAFFRVLGGGTC